MFIYGKIIKLNAWSDFHELTFPITQTRGTEAVPCMSS